MIRAVLSNPSHPEYGVATIPFPIPRDQYAHCMELLEALEIGDAVKADCRVEEIDRALQRAGITDSADVWLRLEDTTSPRPARKVHGTLSLMSAPACTMTPSWISWQSMPSKAWSLLTSVLPTSP